MQEKWQTIRARTIQTLCLLCVFTGLDGVVTDVKEFIERKNK